MSEVTQALGQVCSRPDLPEKPPSLLSLPGCIKMRTNCKLRTIHASLQVRHRGVQWSVPCYLKRFSVGAGLAG